MKSLLFSLISTQRGWVVRQVLKYVAMGSAALTTWLVAKGYDPDSATALAAGLAAGISGGLELLLSKLASKIAAQ